MKTNSKLVCSDSESVGIYTTCWLSFVYMTFVVLILVLLWYTRDRWESDRMKCRDDWIFRLRAVSQRKVLLSTCCRLAFSLLSREPLPYQFSYFYIASFFFFFFFLWLLLLLEWRSFLTSLTFDIHFGWRTWTIYRI